MMNAISDWVKVQAAAALGVGTPWAVALVDKFGPVLDTLIKAGQIGVACVTILFIYQKWRNARNRKKP
jgi:hypothetical protein